MIWLAIVALALLTVAPMAVLAWRGGRLRGRQEAAIRLHRAQLAELDRDLGEGRIVVAEHDAAKLEVQRRLLADAALTEKAGSGSGRGVVLATLVLIPAVALLLFFESGGTPQFPPADAPTAAEVKAARDSTEINQLRARLALMDPHAPRTLEGWTILGRAEMSRGNLGEAAAAWQHVLAEKFDPDLAADTAELMSQAAGTVTPEAAAMFRRALAEAPPDVPWRKMVERRLRDAGGG